MHSNITSENFQLLSSAQAFFYINKYIERDSFNPHFPIDFALRDVKCMAIHSAPLVKHQCLKQIFRVSIVLLLCTFSIQDLDDQGHPQFPIRFDPQQILFPILPLFTIDSHYLKRYVARHKGSPVLLALVKPCVC